MSRRGSEARSPTEAPADRREHRLRDQHVTGRRRMVVVLLEEIAALRLLEGRLEVDHRHAFALADVPDHGVDRDLSWRAVVEEVVALADRRAAEKRVVVLRA